MMKHKIYFFCSVLLYGSVQGAMTPAGRALVPYAQPVNQVAHNPAQLNDLLNALHSKGKAHYVHDVQPTPPAAALAQQKLLDQEAEKTLALFAAMAQDSA